MSRRVVGIHSVHECLKVRPKAIAKLLVSKSGGKSLDPILALANKNGVSVKTVNPSSLDSWARTHQGVGAEVNETPEVDWGTLEDKERQSLVVVFDEVTDPQNLGAIMRTSWLMGADAVFGPKDRAVKLTPAVCKAASGATEHLPYEAVTNISETMSGLKESGYWVYGLGIHGAKELWSEDFPQKVALVLGAEGEGMRPKTEKNCDILLKIPQKDPEASFNVSVSAGIAMAEVRRQWQIP